MTPEQLKSDLDAAWTIGVALLVYFMHGGFGFFEAGMCHRKNTVDTLSHNLMILAATLVVYWAVGFGLMYGNGNAFVGLSGFLPGLSPEDTGTFGALAEKTVPLAVAFAFAMAFADTPATLIAGTGAERIHFVAVLVLTTIISGLVFPVVGHWVVGGGWLAVLPRPLYDTGSGLVHLCGGCCALAVALLLGPRRGRFKLKKSEQAPAVSSMPMVFLGAFILWLGFFAFNAGFAMQASRSIGLAVANTAIAGGAGAVASMAGAWLLTGKAELRITIVGLLTANVAVSSPSSVVEPWSAALIGLIAALATHTTVRLLTRLRLDDPTEYLTMNLVGGLLGLVSVGLFASPRILEEYGATPLPGAGLVFGGIEQLGSQLLGVLAIIAFALPITALACLGLRQVALLRVTASEEKAGSDRVTHGEKAHGDGQSEEPEP